MVSEPSVSLGVIGVGLAGGGVASALRAAGYEVVGVNARSTEAKERAEVMLPGVPLQEADDVARGSDLLSLAVPDDQIEKVAEELAEQGVLRPGQVVAHLWGGGGTEVLSAARAAGATPIALHPAMTFTGTSLDVARLQDCPVAYTADPLAAPIAQAIITSMGGKPFEVSEADRPLYHAALVHGANHLVTLVNEAALTLSDIGVSDPAEVMAPLTRTALNRALEEGWAGLTGPAARGNWSTIAGHLKALAARPELASVAQSYEAMADATRRAIQKPRTETQLVTTRAELAEALDNVVGPTSLVMTMGALHEGHLSLVERAAEGGATVVATIFVNPKQFGEGEDFDKYPRQLEADVEALGEAGAHIVFAPSEDQVYQVDPQVTVNPGPTANVLEGALRPGHFEGVTLVVNKVLNLVRPDKAVFGQKDAQQFSVISQMVRDLDIPVELVEAPIVRDEDGLALSSRNAYLSDEQRRDALALNEALQAGAGVASEGGTPGQVVEAAVKVLKARVGVSPQYVALATKDNFEPVEVWAEEGSPIRVTRDSGQWGGGSAYLAVAAKVGDTRLIDNAIVEVNG